MWLQDKLGFGTYEPSRLTPYLAPIDEVVIYGKKFTKADDI